MKVEELVIDGFKSYSVRTVITSWDPQFNAITGLNGSGKSNILDAICFVLGIVSTNSLRAHDYQDLIYKKGQAGVTKASVTVTFDNSDKKNTPLGYTNVSKISLTRRIVLTGPNATRTDFLINGRKATHKEVAAMLQSVKLNINNPNFLIMQGKITKMLNMKPKQILNLIEEAAGTKSYEAQRDSSVKMINKKEAKLNTIRSTLTDEVKPKMVELEKQTLIVNEFKDKATEKDKYMQILEALNYEESTKILESVIPNLDSATEKQTELAETIKNYESQIDQLSNDINEIKSKNQSNESNELLKELEPIEKTLLNELTRLKTSSDLKISRIEELKNLINSKTEQIREIENKINGDSSNLDFLQNNFMKEEEDFKNYKETLQRKEDLLSTLSTGISSKSTDTGYTSQLREANKKLTETKTLIEQDKLKIKHYSSKVDPESLKHHQNEISKYESEIQKRSENINQIEEKLRQSGFDQAEYDNLKIEEEKLNNELIIKNRNLQDFTRQDSRFDFQYEKPTPDFDYLSVKGLCGELFKLPDSQRRAATALEVCAGFKLFNVVVDNEKTGSLILEKGRLRKRITIIPLNKISSKVVRSDVVDLAKREAPNKVELALNLIEYDKSYQKAIEYVFGNKLICDDPDTAKRVTFDNRIRTGSITLDGDNYDPEGRLSGGSRRASSSTIYKFAKYKYLKDEVDKIKRRLREISHILNKMNTVAVHSRDIQEKLISEEHHVNSLKAKLKNSESAMYIENFKKFTDEINELNKSISLNTDKLEHINNEIKQTNKDIKEFNSDGSKKLRQLEEEIKMMNKEVHKKEKELSVKRQKLNSEVVHNEDLVSDKNIYSEEITKMNDEIDTIKQAINSNTEIINDKQLQLDEVSEKIKNEKETSRGFIVELNALLEHLKNTKEKLSNCKREYDNVSENVTKLNHSKKEAKSRINHAIDQFEWLSHDERRSNILASNPNVSIDFCYDKIQSCETRIAQLKSKGADENIIQQFNDLITLQDELLKKIDKIEKDKQKIKSTITKLDEHLHVKLNETYEKVSKEFGETFALLLPDAYAKLEKTDKNEGDITQGLEVRVRLGSVWKESLVELSGGQRSLVALALIMSLLQYNPAPLYILDEVDAALDLSHTQSIGHLIKTKFKGAQFIVVSLKEGMFTNANQLFKVRFQDGTSVVSATKANV